MWWIAELLIEMNFDSFVCGLKVTLIRNFPNTHKSRYDIIKKIYKNIASGSWFPQLWFFPWSLISKCHGWAVLSIVSFHHDVSTLVPTDHWLHSLKPWAKQNELCYSNEKLTNMSHKFFTAISLGTSLTNFDPGWQEQKPLLEKNLVTKDWNSSRMRV